MARRRPVEMSLDSLMDTLTNVVGILIIVLVMAALDVQKAVERIRERNPEEFGISPQQLDEAMAAADELHEKRQQLAAEGETADRTATLARQQLVATQASLRVLEQPPAASPQERLQQVQRQVQDGTKKFQDVQQQLVKANDELQKLKGLLDKTPVVAAPPPKIVQLPNPRNAPEGSKELLFICRAGRVMPFDPNELRDKVKKRVEFMIKPYKVRAGPNGEIDCQKLCDEFNKSPVLDDEFKMRLVVENYNLVLVYEHKGGGETVEKLAGVSRYRAIVSKIPAAKFHARFLVWPDSFDVYVEARRILDEFGVLGGWQPYDASYEWRIGLGITVACQGKPKPPPPSATPAPAPAPGPPPPPLPNDQVD